MDRMPEGWGKASFSHPQGRQEDREEQDCSLDVWEGNGGDSPGNHFQNEQEGDQ